MRINEHCESLPGCSFDPETLMPCGQNQDPRLAAEQTCAVALLRNIGQAHLEKSSNLLEIGVATGSIDEYGPQAQANFQKIIDTNPDTQDAYQARMALATLPLFEKRARRQEITDEDKLQAYRCTAQVLQHLQLTRHAKLDKSQQEGIETEAISLALALRPNRHNTVAFPTMFRSDMSRHTDLNHDLEIFADGKKYPVQLKRRYLEGETPVSKLDPEQKVELKSGEHPAPAVKTENGVVAISLFKFRSMATKAYADKRGGWPPKKSRDLKEIATMIAYEADESHPTGSREQRYLTHLSETFTELILNEDVDYETLSLHDDLSFAEERKLNKQAQDAVGRLGHLVGQQLLEEYGTAHGELGEPYTVNAGHGIRVDYDNIEMSRQLLDQVEDEDAIERTRDMAALFGISLEETDDFTASDPVVEQRLTLKNGDERVLTVKSLHNHSGNIIESPNGPIVNALAKHLDQVRKRIHWTSPETQS